MKRWFLRGCVGLVVLAIGVTLGTGPLQRSARQRDQALTAETSKVRVAQGRITALNAERRFGEAFAAASERTLVAGKLSGETVALVLLPGAPASSVAALRAVLIEAGAQVTSQATLASSLASTAGRPLVEALTSQMVAQYPTLPVPANASGYVRFGALLARGVAADRRTGAAGSAYDQAAVGILAGLEAANLVKDVTVAPRAALTVVVSGPPAADVSAASVNAIPVAILSGYASATPTLLTGSAAAAGPLGVLGALRSDRTVSSAVSGVDSIETAMGRVAVVLALVARVHGTVGQYGGVGATDGALPAS
jgi:hypothetical protein